MTTDDDWLDHIIFSTSNLLNENWEKKKKWTSELSWEANTFEERHEAKKKRK